MELKHDPYDKSTGAVKRFNRTFMELKLVMIILQRPLLLSFNRTFMELKLASVATMTNVLQF